MNLRPEAEEPLAPVQLPRITISFCTQLSPLVLFLLLFLPFPSLPSPSPFLSDPHLILNAIFLFYLIFDGSHVDANGCFVLPTYVRYPSVTAIETF